MTKKKTVTKKKTTAKKKTAAKKKEPVSRYLSPIAFEGLSVRKYSECFTEIKKYEVRLCNGYISFGITENLDDDQFYIDVDLSYEQTKDLVQTLINLMEKMN